MSQDEDILARTLYGEARGEKIAGMEAIASVILNRLAFSRQKNGYWWGNTITEICRKPYQFSCWNQDDVNYQKIISVGEDDKSFGICRRIARRAVSGLLKDETQGATHYHHFQIMPQWAKGKIPCAEIGSHLFYNNIEG